MDFVARHAVGRAKLGYLLAQGFFVPFELLGVVAALGETVEKLLYQRRHRSTALGGNDAGAAVGLVI